MENLIVVHMNISLSRLKTNYWLVSVLFVIPLFGHAQQRVVFSAMSYNAENLFDYMDDSTKNDNEFLPESDKKWTKDKYYKKLVNISKVIVASGKVHVPDVVGLVEVENRKCLNDLVFNTPLSKLQYSFVHYESPDMRGIDVALLYRIESFRVISSYPVSILFPDDRNSQTRDILYVKGYSQSLNDTLHIFVNHWPSRRGGKKKSESKRIYVASVLKSKVDSVLSTNASANLIILGDFNDYPDDISIRQTLGADSSRCTQCLHNYNPRNYDGTYKYQGKWNTLDQIIVTGSFMKKYTSAARIVHDSFLLSPDEKNLGEYPLKTYNGPTYKGGYSDHLPVILEVFE